MNLWVTGCDFRTAGVGVREKLAFDPPGVTAALAELTARHADEAVVLSTCNRVELVTVGGPFDAAGFLAGRTGLAAEAVAPVLYRHADSDAVRHLVRVAASLNSLVVGEGQIAGQVRQAFEAARAAGATGPLLNALVPHALRAAKRVRTETGIAHGHVSVSSVAVDYVRQVFDQFADKTVLVIGAGKMARLTLTHLKALAPREIVVTNRSPAKAAEVAQACGGRAVPWDRLDDALAAADIALSTTGAAEPVMPAGRFADRVAPRRAGTLVVLDIAVPRDFDPLIHDGDRVCLFNIDDLQRVREQTLKRRHKHVAAAEAIVEAEVRRFAEDWGRRKSGPVIGKLTAEADKLRAEVVGPLLGKLNGSLTADERKQIEGAFRLFQNRLLHVPIAALQEAHKQGQGGTLLESVKKLFRLE